MQENRKSLNRFTIQDQLAKSTPELKSTLSLGDIETVLRNQKLSFLVIVPLSALGTWLVFRRTGYYYAEHIVAIVFLLAMNTLLGFVIGVIGLFPIEYSIFKVAYYIVSIFVVGYGIWFFWQFSQRAKYSTAGRLWRVIAGYLIVVMVLSLGQQFLMGVAAGQRAKAGEPTTEMLE